MSALARSGVRLALLSFCALLMLTQLQLGWAAASGGPALAVDAGASKRHPISPYIYGMNFADPALAAAIKLPVRRWGGNSVTRYNFQNDTSNHASDWYFENIPEDNANPGALPNGSAADQYIDQNRAFGGQTIMTMPLIGWTPKTRALTCGYSVAKYGAQQNTDPWHPDCGNGVRPDSSLITTNDPTDTSIAITPAFDQSWISHLIGRYGKAAAGGVLFYDLDNEPMLWNSTHRDVHPQPTSYDEMNSRTAAYASAIKATDPTAQVLGPAEWGWTGYFYSALDEAAGGAWWNNPVDRLAHGNIPFVEWYLQQMKAYEMAHGKRILDYLDLHYYPEANGVSLSPVGDANTQALRLRSTRSLWDPTYTDESWIGQAVQLIPMMHNWVNADYPNTKIAISEYNWGALDHINGALAQADVLGIFGREGVDLATLWGPPAITDPGAYAFRMYRNYDGAGSQFGSTGVSAASTDQSQLAIYGALRGKNALTLMIINKTGGSLTSNVTLSNFTASGGAQVYTYSAANLNAIVRGTDVAVSAGGFTGTFPASSITLVVIPQAIPPDTIGVYRNGSFLLRRSNTSGAADVTVSFHPGSKPYPVVGDWIGQGFDTPGVYDQATGNFYLRDSYTSGNPNHILTLGNANDLPLSGRWNATATHDGAGVFRPTNGLIYLRNTLTTGFADYVMVLGSPGDLGLAGDWIGQGYDTPGVFRPSKATFYLSNKRQGTVYADLAVVFGLNTDRPFAGDWIGQGHDGIGLLRASTGQMFLKNVLQNGSPNINFAYSTNGDIPVAGNWNIGSGSPPPPDGLIVSNQTPPQAPTLPPPASSFDG